MNTGANIIVAIIHTILNVVITDIATGMVDGVYTLNIGMIGIKNHMTHQIWTSNTHSPFGDSYKGKKKCFFCIQKAILINMSFSEFNIH